MRGVVRKIWDVLDELEGLDATDVGLKLLDEGVTGYREIGSSCPLANYLRRRVNPPSNVSINVLKDRIVVATNAPEPGQPPVVFIPLSDGVAGFVQAFDDGDWPELEEPED
ncbi:MAG TPA: hypothetical protein VIK75_00325 [Calditerricola sp.]